MGRGHGQERSEGSRFGVRGSGFGVWREVLELVGLYHDELVELQQACDGGRLAWLGPVVRVRIMVRLMVRVGVRIRVRVWVRVRVSACGRLACAHPTS